MASTPLQMLLCGFGVAASADVIRAHSLAMFLPGFVTGRLIQKFGVHRIILLGGAADAGLRGGEPGVRRRYFATFLVALALLGVGWNFMFVGGTTLLTTAYSIRPSGCACRDCTISSCSASVACTAVSSGAMQATQGWEVLNLTVVPPVLDRVRRCRVALDGTVSGGRCLNVAVA